MAISRPAGDIPIEVAWNHMEPENHWQEKETENHWQEKSLVFRFHMSLTGRSVAIFYLYAIMICTPVVVSRWLLVVSLLSSLSPVRGFNHVCYFMGWKLKPPGWLLLRFLLSSLSPLYY